MLEINLFNCVRSSLNCSMYTDSKDKLKPCSSYTKTLVYLDRLFLKKLRILYLIGRDLLQMIKEILHSRLSNNPKSSNNQTKDLALPVLSLQVSLVTLNNLQTLKLVLPDTVAHPTC